MSAAAIRTRAADTLVDLFYDDERLALVLADISLDLLEPVLRHDPRRAVNVGIMEQAAVGVAAGFASRASTQVSTRWRRSWSSARSSRSSSTSATRASAGSSSRLAPPTTTGSPG